MRFLIIVLMAMWVVPLWAKSVKATCSAKELRHQDCELRSGKYKLSLLGEKLSWSDGTWHSVDPLPLKGDGISWEKVRFEVISGWPILQLWIWDKAEGEAQVQSLRWFVEQIGDRQVKRLESGVVRRRRLKPMDPPAEPVGPPVDKSKLSSPEYIYDSWEPHRLAPLKGGRLEFNLGRSKKILERDKHGV